MAESLHQTHVDYYSILGVARTADNSTIRTSYRRLARLWHPDRHHAGEFDRERSEDMMKRITTAYRVLIDTSSRQQYDTTASDDTEGEMTDPFDVIRLGYRQTESSKFEMQLKSWEREADEARSLNPHPLGETKEGCKLRSDVNGLLSRQFEGLERNHEDLARKCPTSQRLSSSTGGNTTTEKAGESQHLKEQYLQFVDQLTNRLTETKLPRIASDSYKKEMEGKVEKSGGSSSRLPEVSVGSKICYSSVTAKTLEAPRCVVSTPSRWVPDSERPNCVGCSVKFIPVYVRRKHHCRSCGEVYCKACTVHWIRLRKYGFTSPVRVCHSCYRSHVQEYKEKWLEHATTLVKDDGNHFQSWAAFLIAVSLQSPDDRPRLILKAIQEFRSSRNAELAVLWSAQFFSSTALNSSTSLKMHRVVAEYLYNCAMDARQTDKSKRLHLLYAALGGEYCMQDIAHRATPSLDYVSDVEQKIRSEVRRTEEHERQTRRDCVEKGVAALTAALDKYDMNLFVSSVSQSDEEIVRAFMEKTKLSKDTDNSWHLLALTLCQMRMQAADWQTLNTLDRTIWSGIGKVQHEQVVSWAVSIAIGIIEAGGWNWVQQARGRALASTAVTMAAGDFPEPPSTEYFKTMSVKGLKVRHIRKYEVAVEKKVANKEWDARQVAMAYIDLLPSCDHPSQIAMCSVTIAMWLLKSMRAAVDTVDVDKPAKEKTRVSVKQLGIIHSLHKGISEWVSQALLFSELFLPPAMRLHIAQQSFRCITAACLLAGVKDLPETMEQSLQRVIRLTRLFPVGSTSYKMSSILVSEAVLFDVLMRDLHDPFLSDMQSVDPKILLPTVRQSQLYYQLYETGMSGLGSVEERVREVAMDELLADKGWSWENVESLMKSPIIPQCSDGWLKEAPRSLSDTVSRGFSKILGLAVDKKNNQLKLLARRSSNNRGLVSMDDFAAAVEAQDKGFGAFFSLDPPEANSMRYHPFQTMFYEPRALEGTELLHTIFHTDYLLKQFSTGIEVNQTPPFKQRTSQLTSCLPRKLRAVLLPVYERHGSRSLSHIHRFWIQATRMDYSVEQDENYVYYLVGDVAMEVRCRPMMPNTDGELRDIADEEDKETGEYKFAEDFTNHYDDIGRAFPEFLRLKELCKLLWLGQVANSHGKMLEEQARSPNITHELIEMNFDAARKDCIQKISQMLTEMEKHLPMRYSYDYASQKRMLREEISKHIGVSMDRLLFDGWWDLPSSESRMALAESIGTRLTPSRTRIRQMMEEEAKRIFTQKMSQYKRNLRELKAYRKKEEIGECTWVPAAHRRFPVTDDAIRQVYGGVALFPKLRETVLTKPSRGDFHSVQSMNSQRQSQSTNMSECMKVLTSYRPKCPDLSLPAAAGAGSGGGSRGGGGSGGGDGDGGGGGRRGGGGRGGKGGDGDGGNGGGNGKKDKKDSGAKDGSRSSSHGTRHETGGNRDQPFTETGYSWTLQDALLLLPSPLPETMRQSFRDQSFRLVVSDGCTLGRLYDSTWGSEYGSYWTFMSDSVSPRSQTLRSDLAILTQWSDMAKRNVMYLPQGLYFFIGQAASQGNLPGGGIQVVFPCQTIVYHICNMNEAAARGDWGKVEREYKDAVKAQEAFFRSFKREQNIVFRRERQSSGIQYVEIPSITRLTGSSLYFPFGSPERGIAEVKSRSPEFFYNDVISKLITSVRKPRNED